MGIGKDNRYKSDIFSLLVIILIIFVVVIVMYFTSLLSNNIIFNLKSSGEFTSQYGNTTLNDMDGKPIRLTDSLLPLLLFGWLIALIISAVWTDFHPAVMIIFFIILLIGVWVQMQTANIYSELFGTENVDLIDGSARYTKTNLVFTSPLPIITLVVGIIILIIMYSKRGGGQQF